MLDQEKKTASAPGRPRSDQSHYAILQATREILEQDGYRAMTIEGIAARAGVSKKTIYRWWPSKPAVALEALAAYTGEAVPFPDTGSLERDLLTYFEQSIEGLQGHSGGMLRGLAAEAQLDPAFEQEFQRTFIVPRKDDLIVLLQRGVQRGELPSDINLHVLADLIYGAKWYRLLLYPAPLDLTFAQDMVVIVRHLKP